MTSRVPANSLGANLGIAAVVGLVVAAFVLGAICGGVASLVHRRYANWQRYSNGKSAITDLLLTNYFNSST